MVEAQQRAMEMERRESEVVVKKRCAILDRAIFLEKGIKILNPKRFMWT
jgi:ribosomal protein L32E